MGDDSLDVASFLRSELMTPWSAPSLDLAPFEVPLPVWLEALDIPALPPNVLPNIGIFDSNNSKKELLNPTRVTTLCVDGVLSSNNCDNEGVSLALWLDVSVGETSVPTLSSNGDSTASVDWSSLDSTQK